MNDVRKPENKTPKRFIMDISKEFHKQLKAEAVYRNQSMRQYVLEAILERMKKDLTYRR